jgi:DNA polymerase-3 subunit epsilon
MIRPLIKVPMREIVFDTETTGLDPLQGDRMVEIGCIELINRFPSGKTFHCYFNPERDIPEPAFKVHGLSVDFLNDAPLIAHNAMFDLGFLNAELERAKKAAVARERLVDTLMLARRKHPGGSNRLDDLCTRYKIDNSKRIKHGALLDAELLAEIYVELIGARQANLGLAEGVSGGGEARVTAIVVRARPQPLVPRIGAEELDAHRAFIATLGEAAIWRQYVPG